ncbi:MAG: hypothetical protein HOD92_07900 [Deltaproteobacteria bacterium]|mgnify:CR=1 FL=1|jgi:hypothetical protein|nr:hypothetical protein [Deltaproteobacteria bacterium]MBT4525743.1 hypothetical protein [Deltaproteobacteria bacterium]
MAIIIDYWATWLFFAIIFAGLMQFVAKNKKSDVQPGMATKSENFSMRMIFLSFRSGEAALFFVVIIITVLFFLFAIGLSKEVSALLPGA